MTLPPPRRSGLRREAVVLLAAAALALVTTQLAPQPVPDLLLWLALVYAYGVGGLLLLRGMDARRRAAARRTELEQQRALPLTEVVEAAVREERRRLAMDIRRVLLEALTGIHQDSSRLLAGRPTGAALAAAVTTLRGRTQLATSELRRLLGILRVAEDEQSSDRSPEDPGPARSSGPAPSSGPARSPVPAASPPPLIDGRPPRRDLVETGVIVALAALECAINLPDRQSGSILPPLLATVLAGALFVGRSVAPILSALAQGLVFATAALLGAPVMSGVWMVRGVGGLLWRSAASPPLRQGLPAAFALGVTVLASRVDEPQIGVLATWVVVLFGLVGGTVAAWSHQRSAAARSEALALQESAGAEVRRAVATERLRLARELHDTVSHSVGVIAMQLNVLDVVGTAEERRSAIGNILGTSTEALRDLNDLDTFPGGIDPTPTARTLDDVKALVQRVREAGARVDLSVIGPPEPGHLSVVYRLLQETLTNALLHAPGAAVQVTVQAGQDGTRLVVEDDGPGSDLTPAPAHYGITGVRERVQLAGGTVHLGRRGPDGGFRLSAHLPPGNTLWGQEVEG